MKLTVVIQVVENGYIVTYKDIVSQNQTHEQIQYAPTISEAQPTQKVVERNFITTSETEIINTLIYLRNKVAGSAE